MRIALIGYGAIGTRVGDLIRAGEAGSVEVVGVLVREPERYTQTAAETGWTFTDDANALAEQRPEIVVEMGGHEVVRTALGPFLDHGSECLIVSVGAFADDEVRERLLERARQGGGRITVPSGAIAGLDALTSAAVIGLDSVQHTVRKYPTTLLPDAEAQEVLASGQPRELYRGPAREAARLFPQNVNVVAAVSFASLGLDRTTAAVIADPAVTRNTHEIHAEGAFGVLDIRLQNTPTDDNPKTGMIVAPSIARALRSRSATFVIGV